MRLAFVASSSVTLGIIIAACGQSVGGNGPGSSSASTGSMGTGATSAHTTSGSHSSSSATTTSTTSSSGTANGGATTTTTATSSGAGGMDGGFPDAPIDIIPPPDGSIMDPCSLPGSVQFKQTGAYTVPGGSPSWPSLSFLNLPVGFCAHYFATVPNARQIRFAPGGELFVASPTASSTGGGPNGLAAIIVLPDDNLDGVADTSLTFLDFSSNTSATNQGILFTPGFFYYQDATYPGTKIFRLPYQTGQRQAAGSPQQVADITVNIDFLHWPRTMDIADDGTIYVGNGSSQSEGCITPHAFKGGILSIDPAPGGANPNGVQIAQGFRNPIAVRCQRGHNQCFALELALDYSNGAGGREKMVPIRKGDDWGFPCCASRNLPYGGPGSGIDCSMVAQDTNSWAIGNTPFGLDFEQGFWPAPWNRRAFVATHGAAGSWVGARIVAIPTDPATGLPGPSTDATDAGIYGADVGMLDFGTGWDDATTTHGRPASLSFASDGRLFVADDNNGLIFWVAPLN